MGCSTLSNPRLLFFQAEDGIRDYKVTGVQTCALPICCAPCEDRFEHAPIGRQILREHQIGRASCRERVSISVVAVSLKKKKTSQQLPARLAALGAIGSRVTVVRERL